MNINDVGITYAPVIREMVMTPQGSGAYDNTGRWCAPPSQLDTYAVSENVKLVSQHQHVQQREIEQLKLAVSGKIAELEQIIVRLDAFNQWVYRTYPAIVAEFQAVQRTVPRIT